MLLVPNPVMPKGVEHLQHRADAVREYNVPNPVMPKGVEHLPTRGSFPDSHTGAESSDAERR